MGTLGAMQDFPLRITRILDHAEREHGEREIVAARADGTTHRTNWTEVTHDARRLAQALERRGIRPTDRIGTLALTRELKERLLRAGAVLKVADNPSAEKLDARGYAKLPSEYVSLMHDAQREEIGLRWAAAQANAVV